MKHTEHGVEDGTGKDTRVPYAMFQQKYYLRTSSCSSGILNF